MKTSLIFSLFALSACGSPSGSSPTASAVPVSTPNIVSPGIASPQATPTATPTATPVSSPAPTATPMPTATPTPTPVPLSCNLTSNNVFCTGGSLGSSVAQLNVVQQTQVDDPSYVIDDLNIVGSQYCVQITLLQNGNPIHTGVYCGSTFDIATDVLQ